jgi:hypothetical protein
MRITGARADFRVFALPTDKEAKENKRSEETKYANRFFNLVYSVISGNVYFSKRVKRSKKMLDQGNNPPFIIRYR